MKEKSEHKHKPGRSSAKPAPERKEVTKHAVMKAAEPPPVRAVSRRKTVNDYEHHEQQQETSPEPQANSASEPAQAGPLVWNGFINRNQPQDMALLKAFPTGTVMARYSRNDAGIAYMDAKHGTAIFFPNPDTYPLKGYFAGEEIPLPEEAPAPKEEEEPVHG